MIIIADASRAKTVAKIEIKVSRICVPLDVPTFLHVFSIGTHIIPSLIMLLRLILLSVYLTVSTVKSAGTWYCEPCWSSECSITNSNAWIDYPATSSYSGGSIQCKDIRNRYSGITRPDVCSKVQPITFDDSNPCGCRGSNGDVCEEADVSSGNEDCLICGSGDKVVGDPNRVIGSDGQLPGLLCGDLQAYSGIAFTASTCPLVQADVAKYCQCTSNVYSVPQCVQDDMADYTKSRCTKDTTCCEGQCQFRGAGELLCSNRNPISKDQWPEWALEAVGHPDDNPGGNDGGTASGSAGWWSPGQSSSVMPVVSFAVVMMLGSAFLSLIL